MTNNKTIWLAISAALLLLFGFTALPVFGSSPAAGAPVLVPSPRPPITPTAESGGERDSDSSGRQSAIIGQVTDLSSGAPGRQIEVSVSSYPPVRTDREGRYSVSGLAAGDYTVQLLLGGAETPAQEPVTVKLDGNSTVQVDLDYYSIVPAPSPVADQPSALPETGGSNAPWMFIGIGVLFLALSGGLQMATTRRHSMEIGEISDSE